MRTIYIDADYVCHAGNADGRTAVETDALDNVCDHALPFYRFVPAHDGKEDFVQCFDSKTADAVQKQYEEMQAEFATSYQEGVNSI